MGPQWIIWEPRGRDLYSNPRARYAHLGDPSGGPTACGRWVPNDLDAIIRLAPRAPRCKRCARVAAKAVQILGELEAES